MRVLVDEGPDRVHELIALGAVFDVDASAELSRAREAATPVPPSSMRRAATGMEIERALVAAVCQTAATVLDRTFALALIVEGGRCAGVTAIPEGHWRRDHGPQPPRSARHRRRRPLYAVPPTLF